MLPILPDAADDRGDFVAPGQCVRPLAFLASTPHRAHTVLDCIVPTIRGWRVTSGAYEFVIHWCPFAMQSGFSNFWRRNRFTKDRTFRMSSPSSFLRRY
ncbi:hypothetical protein GCM10010922_12080 [Microbacterium sorbitolivorans]|nr:hypothetical protein GCM10010922_12080 [Microbacterium sorbitolivorans]